MDLSNIKTSKDAYKWNMLRDAKMGQYLFQQEYTFIRRHLDDSTQVVPMLEVGCGSGLITQPLHSEGYRIIGMDLDPIALDVFWTETHDIPLFRGNAVQLPFAANSIGTIIAIQTLEYIDYQLFFQECNRLMKNGGLLIFDAINRSSYKWYLKKLSGRSLDTPSSNLSAREILGAGTANNFEIQEVHGYNWVPFVRESNNMMIKPLAEVERRLHLRKYYRISPKILVALRKRT